MMGGLDRATLYQVAGIAVKFLTGPLTMLFILHRLTPEEQGFYFTFFSTLAAAQLAEAGMSFVAVQSVSGIAARAGDGGGHDRLLDRVVFLFLWFLGVSLFVLTGVKLFGEFMFSAYSGLVDWQGAWWCLVVASAVMVLTSAGGFVLEGLQKSDLVFRSQLVSGLLSSVTLWLSLIAGAGLYSVGFSVAAGTSFLIVSYFFPLRSVVRGAGRRLRERGVRDIFASELAAVWPLFSRISLTWISGYFFWNSFSLIGFALKGPVFAGRLGITLALLRMGLSVAEAFLSARRSAIAYLIAAGQAFEAESLYRARNRLAHGVLIIGYGAFFGLLMVLPKTMVDRILPISHVLLYAGGYLLMLYPLNTAVWLRSYGKEPFLVYSLLQSIILPVGIFFSLKFLGELALAWFFLFFSAVSVLFVERIKAYFLLERREAVK